MSLGSLRYVTLMSMVVNSEKVNLRPNFQREKYNMPCQTIFFKLVNQYEYYLSVNPGSEIEKFCTLSVRTKLSCGNTLLQTEAL